MSTIMQSLQIYLLGHGPESITMYLLPPPTHSHTPILLNFDMSKISNDMLQNGYQNVNETSFFICGSKLLNLFILCDLVAETSISDVYCSSSDL